MRKTAKPHNVKVINMRDKTNWKNVKKITERQISASAKSGPDAKILTTKQLKKFKCVILPQIKNIA